MTANNEQQQIDEGAAQDEAQQQQQAEAAQGEANSNEKESRQYTEEEAEAIAKGWNPDKENFKGDWQSAKAFLKYKKLTDQIHKQEREKRAMNRNMQKMEENLTELRELVFGQNINELARTKGQLEAQRDYAVEMGDKDAFKQADEGLKAVEERAQQLQNQQKAKKPQEPEAHPEALEWAEKNKDWFNTDTQENAEMFEFAHLYGETLHRRNPNADINESLDKIKKAVERAYPHRFKVQQRSPQFRAVESDSKQAKPRTKGYDDLPPEVKVMADQWNRQSGVDKNKFAQTYFSQMEK